MTESAGNPASRPLEGRTILITRPRAQTGPLSEALQSLGARVIAIPALEILPPADSGPLDRALENPDAFAAVVFTSANAVESVVAQLASAGRKPDALAGPLIAAIGPATADRLRGFGLTANIVPHIHTSEGLLEALAGTPLDGKKVLIPAAAEGRRVIAEGLSRRGADVLEVEAYRTVRPSLADPDIRQALDELARSSLDLAVFASPSAVNNLAEILDSSLRERVLQAPAAAIGPVTARAARLAGYRVVAEPEGQTVDAVISSIRKYFGNK